MKKLISLKKGTINYLKSADHIGEQDTVSLELILRHAKDFKRANPFIYNKALNMMQNNFYRAIPLFGSYWSAIQLYIEYNYPKVSEDSLDQILSDLLYI